MTGRPPIASSRVEQILSELTLEELGQLTVGRDMWSAGGVKRLGLAPFVLTDGSSGARGPFLAGEGVHTSAALPGGPALASSWDPTLAEEVGAAIAEQARTKGARILLAPTVNLHRSPLAGRNAECFSEDPLLSGAFAAAFIRGAQSQGVACTVKHLVGNEAETERSVVDSQIDERTLREIYLIPFEMAVREGGVRGVMTAYNRLNGIWCSEHPWLIDEVLRREWRFDGFVVSDWNAIGSTAGSVAAGLDLEMPGPGRYLGDALVDAVRRGEVEVDAVQEQARRILRVLDDLGALDDAPIEPRSVDLPADRQLARRAVAAGVVLLQNTGVLPLDSERIATIAVSGPNAEAPTLMCGGAATFHPHYVVTPLDALRERFGAARITYEPGSSNGGRLPVLRTLMTVKLFEQEDADTPVETLTYPHTQAVFPGEFPGTGIGPYHLRATGRFSVAEAGRYCIGLTEHTPAQVLVDGRVVLDSIATPPEPGRFPWMPQPLTAELDLDEGEHDLAVVATGSALDPANRPIAGYTVGFARAVTGDAIERAVAAATEADVAVVVVGSDPSWETEAFDRPHMNLRRDQDELVERVAAANPNTVVVVNTGTAVAMPWADQVAAVVQLWFAGQEIGNGLVDVLAGDTDPGGRLPTTIPRRIEHTACHGAFPGEGGVTRYAEGVFVGYRHHTSRDVPVRFPFGHGLSYTTFQLDEPQLSRSATSVDDVSTKVRVLVRNIGERRGSEVVQCYVAPPPDHQRPVLELRAFEKVMLEPGEEQWVEFELGARAFSRWQPARADHEMVLGRLAELGLVDEVAVTEPGWVVDPGTYQVHVGRSSADLPHSLPFIVSS